MLVLDAVSGWSGAVPGVSRWLSDACVSSDRCIGSVDQAETGDLNFPSASPFGRAVLVGDMVVNSLAQWKISLIDWRY